MSDLSRRSILRGGLRTALGVGGIMLPFAGTKALTFAEPAAAADLAVIETSFPLSRDLIRYRAMLREHEEWRLDATIARCFSHEPPSLLAEEVGLRRRVYEDQAKTIMARPVHSWGDVAELAEIAWQAAPKRQELIGPDSDRTCLARGFWNRCEFIEDFGMVANAALIEAVLTMSGGQRYDPTAAFNDRWRAYQLGR